MVRHLSMDNAVPAIFMVRRGGISGRAYISPRICRMYDKYDILLLHGCKYFRLVFKIAAIIGSYCLLCIIAGAFGLRICLFISLVRATLASCTSHLKFPSTYLLITRFIVFTTLPLKVFFVINSSMCTGC